MTRTGEGSPPRSPTFGAAEEVRVNDANSDWWGRLDPDAKLAEKKSAVAARTARALGVPLDEVHVTEHPEPQGVRLTASWCPA